MTRSISTPERKKWRQGKLRTASISNASVSGCIGGMLASCKLFHSLFLGFFHLRALFLDIHALGLRLVGGGSLVSILRLIVCLRARLVGVHLFGSALAAHLIFPVEGVLDVVLVFSQVLPVGHSN